MRKFQVWAWKFLSRFFFGGGPLLELISVPSWVVYKLNVPWFYLTLNDSTSLYHGFVKTSVMWYKSTCNHVIQRSNKHRCYHWPTHTHKIANLETSARNLLYLSFIHYYMCIYMHVMTLVGSWNTVPNPDLILNTGLPKNKIRGSPPWTGGVKSCKPDPFRSTAPIAFSIGTRMKGCTTYWKRSALRNGKGLACESVKSLGVVSYIIRLTPRYTQPVASPSRTPTCSLSPSHKWNSGLGWSWRTVCRHWHCSASCL